MCFVVLLTAAINSEPLGPYNKELHDLSQLSYSRKSLHSITEHISKRLAKVVQQAAKPGRSIQRSRSVITKQNTVNVVKRASSVSGPFNELAGMNELVVLKSLTVLVYLCQYGSGLFISWMRKNYGEFVLPLGRLAFAAQYSNAIHQKVGLIVRYCEDDAFLLSARNSLDQLRDEIRPGIVEHDPPVIKRNISPQHNLTSIIEDSRLRYTSTNPLVKR